MCCSVLWCVAVFLIGLFPLQVEVGYQIERVAVCCGVLQCIAVCCSMLQCVTLCCSVLRCVAVFLIGLLPLQVEVGYQVERVAVCCSVLQCVAVCCSVLQAVVAVCCSVLQTVASQLSLFDNCSTDI